jgi:hypothetical protein
MPDKKSWDRTAVRILVHRPGTPAKPGQLRDLMEHNVRLQSKQGIQAVPLLSYEQVTTSASSS